MISTSFNKIFMGGAGKAIIPLKVSPTSSLLIGVVVIIIDLLIRAFIFEYGYKLLVEKTKVNMPKLDFGDSLILIIIITCLIRN